MNSLPNRSSRINRGRAPFPFSSCWATEARETAAPERLSTRAYTFFFPSGSERSAGMAPEFDRIPSSIFANTPWTERMASRSESPVSLP